MDGGDGGARVERDAPARAQVEARLRAAGCVFAEDEAALLTEAASGDALRALVDQRVAGRPLEYLLGWAGFAGLRMTVTDGVFVPRGRTELLLRLADRHAVRGGCVVELCCGVAPVAATLAVRRHDLRLVAADLDPDAVACARANLPTGEVYRGDLFEALPPGLRAEVIVANAPYVPTDAIATMPPEAREYERRTALDGGADGLDLHRRIASRVREWLAPGGVLIVEAGRDQAERSAAILAAAGLATRTVTDDEVGGCAVLGSAP